MDQAPLSARAEVYGKARQAQPLRWTKQVRDSSYADTVRLNSDTPQNEEPQNIQKSSLTHHLLATSTLTTSEAVVRASGKLVWRDALAFVDGLKELAGQLSTLAVIHLPANDLATEWASEHWA